MANKRIAISLLTCYCLLQPLHVLAQQQPAAPAGNMPKFTSSTQLVVEVVSVKDKSGNIIEGLTAKDFTVTENGVPQTITFCEFQKLEENVAPVAAPRAAAPSAAPAVPKAAPVTNTQIATEAPGDIKFRDRRLLAIYFDMSAMPVPDQLRALTAARTFVRKQMTKADLLAIMKFEGGEARV